MIRKAKIKDIKAIHSLLQTYARTGELLARPLSELYDHVRDFWVDIDAKSDTVVGCCALQFCWEYLAEIRSLAVHPEHRNRKIGARLIEATLSEAEAFHIRQVFTLTYQPDFFRKYGFANVDRSELPLKIWKDCLLCVKFPDCDETAMMKSFAPCAR